MGEIISIISLGLMCWFWYRVGQQVYTHFRPQIVKVGDLYYIRKLVNPFQWEYARNTTRYTSGSDIWFDSHDSVFKVEETISNTSNGHATLEKAQQFREKHFIRSRAKRKVERVDGLWFMCKNKLSKIKFRKKSANTKVD